MEKEELVNKMEYLNFMYFLKIEYEIANRRYMNAVEQKRVENSKDMNEKIRYRIRALHRQEVIEQLLDHIYVSNSNLTREQKLVMLEYKIHRDFPNIIEGLACGKYCYDWSFSDCTFDYTILQVMPEMKKMYQEQLELKNILMKSGDDSRYSISQNPIYFDLCHLAFLDDSYLSFLADVIHQRSYDPNHLDCVPSNFPFFGLIEKLGIPSLITSVFLDPRTEFSLLVNGSDMLQDLILSSNKEYQKTVNVDFNFSLLSDIFQKKDISVIDTVRFRGFLGVLDDGYDAHISTLVSNFGNCDLPEVQNLFTYLVSDEAIEKQLMISKYPSIYRDDEIDTYCHFIETWRGSATSLVDKLKMLKIN